MCEREAFVCSVQIQAVVAVESKYFVTLVAVCLFCAYDRICKMVLKHDVIKKNTFRSQFFEIILDLRFVSDSSVKNITLHSSAATSSFFNPHLVKHAKEN